MLLRQVEPRLGSDPEFVKLRDSFQVTASIRTEPAGADVYVKPYADVNGRWEHLGQSPLEIRAPIAYSYYRYRVTKAGFAPFEGADGLIGATFTLVPAGKLPANMVRVPGTSFSAPSGTVRLPDFFMGRFEVTNREFKSFVDAGGYRTREFWTEPFVKDGHPVSWDEAMAEFRDATGRPGPATWELGSSAEGQEDFPVHGVSWYEAAAYARYAGQTLPTVHHWRSGAGLMGPQSVFSDILELSNFLSKGPAKVGEFKGIGPFGTYDMAGNVKEWCWNAVGDRRYILGGGWNEPNYQFRGEDARLPFDRSPNDGFRTIEARRCVGAPRGGLEAGGAPDPRLQPGEAGVRRCVSRLRRPLHLRPNRSEVVRGIGRRQRTRMARRTHHVRGALWQRTHCRIPVPAETRSTALSDRCVLSSLGRHLAQLL